LPAQDQTNSHLPSDRIWLLANYTARTETRSSDLIIVVESGTSRSQTCVLCESGTLSITLTCCVVDSQSELLHYFRKTHHPSCWLGEFLALDGFGF